ncbi:MAG: DNA cytosine methyltransferase [Caulobacter sp.]|nr:DNA cytosine methyltransferase [Caulobacter sp.]
MRYGSVCSGIEAASAAWHPLGWRASFLSEIEAFPRAVLSHHYPEVPLHGDFTTIQAGEYDPIDLLVGGTPCQSFSVAGLRGGLDDERGNLALEYLRLADRLRPRWLVWENVPGVLSSDGGRDFGSILGGLVELGYGFAYRVLDAQFFGVAQRRRRVFVVGYLGDWRRAAAVLFERHGLQGHPAPRRETGKAAPTIPSRSSGGGGLGTDFDCDGGLIASTGDVSHCLNAGGMGRQDFETETLVTSFALRGREGGAMPELGGTVANALRTPAGGASVPMVAFNITPSNSNKDYNARQSERAQAVTAGGNRPSARGGDLVVPLLEIGKGTTSRGVGPNGSGLGQDGDPMFTLQAGAQHGVGLTSAVRRLTPRECERLQGFKDDYTLIPWRKGMAPDGPRYKALGNSMAVPVMRWIGERIEAIEAVASERAAA